MKLSQVIKCLKDSGEMDVFTNDPEIRGVEMDSRKVGKGSLFVAIKGFQTDGHHFIGQAVENGAAAVVGEEALELNVPYIKVTDSRTSLGKLASCFYDRPSRKHKIIGITGTNGKTTTAYILKHILETAGRTCSLLGTVSNIINNREYKTSNTTPDALQIQKMLSKSLDEFVVMEISSHALEQSRTEGLELDYGLFTNLAHDHLDYHENMDQYFHDKKKIFTLLKDGGKGVINLYNSWGEKMAEDLQKEKIPLIMLGDEKCCSIKDVAINGRTVFILEMKGQSFEIEFPLPGHHNVYNAAMAFLTGVDLGIDPADIIKALAAFPGIPGRFETIIHPSGAKFVVDYAHTVDAFEYCLEAARQQGAERIFQIYGFRGGRDQSKRMDMIKASAKYCHKFYLTADDLNDESEDEMISQLHRLNKEFGRGKGEVIPDRTLAIQKAWREAGENDWIFITGKGPEAYQKPFALPAESDLETLKLLLESGRKQAVL
ncbi:UDP-N-acetylmuramoyl-L-alanyl-D-glutamate--2,6-diaminopimelate ligase [Cytobacillus firmus]|uniref:UDP-N-acetylmuramoyl-L-alanyl-D-glutamate--2, 6-diaminopimelate ligase n=1 Tax=Cytobacillus firmus TaxID=1399 RepID=UPI00216276ED|nr:UDP-N-acetylmuramoyl-L-alanyl-D-glutamate--2,6-diaminopimelate ligase [Cytobacillus firmus]MCS0672505.1 UDP-N-acetylmuramoyl-L-alanyl-D-glutamate--2,6-diaminopimelate ligase [Cytobacillus firmus]